MTDGKIRVGLMVGREYSFPPAFIQRVNEIGAPHGITAEMVTLGGTRFDEPARYRVIVDRISHEVEYYRGALKHAVLQGTYVINNPFWWTADDKFFNYSVMAKLGVRHPEDRAPAAEGVSAGHRPDVGIAPQHAVPDRLGRAARLRRASGDPEAVLGRRVEARLQGARQEGAARGVRRHGAVLHDAAGVHRFRPVRPLLHLRQDRHHAGQVRSARAPVPRGARLLCRPSSARASCATRRRSTRRSATR